jgi:hypothetical protein
MDGIGWTVLLDIQTIWREVHSDQGNIVGNALWLEQPSLDPKLESIESLVGAEELHAADLLQPIVEAEVNERLASANPTGCLHRSNSIITFWFPINYVAF